MLVDFSAAEIDFDSSDFFFPLGTSIVREMENSEWTSGGLFATFSDLVYHAFSASEPSGLN